jgi:drug/metabolite transporter (DMT)-like permease
MANIVLGRHRSTIGALLHLLALAGVLSISFSPVLVRLAAVSPVTAAFFRAVYALPVLGLIWTYTGAAADARSKRSRWLAGVSGLLWALDLALWHESIALIGVGLATVLPNVQVVFVAAAGWALHRERPTRRTALVVAGILGGLVLISGLARPDAYGVAPILGSILGVLAGGCYAGFLLLFRAANRSLAPTSGPLLDATLGVVAGTLLVSPFDPGFSLVPSLPAHGWLMALAIVSQVAGWLLIATALPRLAALETSVLLLMQPVLSLFWGVLLFAERLSVLQWLGSACVLAGVAMVSRSSPAARTAGAPSALQERA